MNRYSMRGALALAILAVGVAVPAHASFIDALLDTPDGLFRSSDSSGTVTASHTGADYVAQGQTSYGVNKVYSQTTTDTHFVGTSSASTWVTDFNLTGAAPGTPVNVHLVMDYDFTLSVPDGAASWSLKIDSYDLGGNSTGNFSHIQLGTYADNFGFNDHSFDRPNGGSSSGLHSGTLTFDLSYPIQNNLALRVEVDSGANDIGLCDGYNTARVVGISLPDGITWTYGADVPGNPLHVQGVPEPASLGVLAVGGIALLVRPRRKVSLLAGDVVCTPQ